MNQDVACPRLSNGFCKEQESTFLHNEPAAAANKNSSVNQSNLDQLLWKAEVKDILDSLKYFSDIGRLFVSVTKNPVPMAHAVGSEFIYSCLYLLICDPIGFLETIGKENNLSKIRKILFNEFKVSDGSFFRIMVPAAFALSSDVLKTLQIEKQEFCIFITNYCRCLKESWDLKHLPLANSLFFPCSFCQIIAPMAKILHSYFDMNFKSTQEIRDAIDTSDCIIKEWKTAVENGDLDTVESVNGTELVLEIWKKMEFSCILANIEEESFPEKESVEEVVFIPVHDNDHENFSNIKIIPTMDEILCKKIHFLPKNMAFSKSAHFLEPGPLRMLDTNFRLLRHDMVETLKDGVLGFISQLEKKNEVYSGQFTSTCFQNQVNLMVYSKVKFERFKGRKNPIFSFKKPREIRSDEDCVEFWENYLQTGELVCILQIDQKNNYFFEFTTIEHQPRKPPCYRFEVTLKNLSFVENGHCTLYIFENQRVMFEAYRSILLNLQKKVPALIPFSDVICPAADGLDTPSFNLPPKFAQHESFFYDLSFLPTKQESLNLKYYVNQDNIDSKCREIITQTTLDYSQAKSLLHALSKRVSLIQGPPGTGKSFIGVQIIKALCSEIKGSNLPILVICHTNHALDQFLEHLVDEGINEIVRFGGKCSDKMLDYKFSLRGKNESKLSNKNEKIEKIRKELQKLGKKDIEQYLKEKETKYWTELNQKNEKQALKLWLDGKTFDKKSDSKSDIWSLSKKKRNNLHQTWVENFEKLKKKERFELEQKLVKLMEKKKKIRPGVCSLDGRKVLGATCTGASKYLKEIASVSPKIVFCEESGETFEPHLIAGLYSTLHSLILIGDHRQLRPKVNKQELSFESSKDFCLDVSLFEKLVKKYGEKACVQLLNQRRMKPIISQFVQELIYNNLTNNETTMNRESIRGFVNDVYFWSHTIPQDESQRSTSFSNIHEINMVWDLAAYLLMQGYSSDSIVIITPYRGQLEKIEKLFKDANFCEQNIRDSHTDFELEELRDKISSIKVRTVDSFQGEEADIVIICSVRSNPPENRKNKIGFLGLENRINVMLSRARNGMYIVGNSTHLSKSSDNWEMIIEMMKSQNLISEELPITCINHPNSIRHIKNDTRIGQVTPNGRCNLICGRKYKNCDHFCGKLCHMEDDESTVIKHKLQNNDNSCIPSCGLCEVDCGTKTLKCSHEYPNIKCHQLKNFDQVECIEKSTISLPCTHKTKLKCGQNISDAGPCTKACEQTKCKHGKCENNCGSLCDLCSEECEWSCSHRGTCPFPCGVPCVRLPCDLRCQKLLECKHQCPGICGEECPSQKFCQLCAEESIQNTIIGGKKFLELDLNQTPIIVLKCFHFFTMQQLDEIIGIGDFYKKNKRGNWQMLMTPQNRKKLMCPKCFLIFTKNEVKRYGRVVNRNNYYSDSSELMEMVNDFNVGISSETVLKADFKIQTENMLNKVSKLAKIHCMIQKSLTSIKKSQGKWEESVLDTTVVTNEYEMIEARLLLTKSILVFDEENPNDVYEIMKKEALESFELLAKSISIFQKYKSEEVNHCYLQLCRLTKSFASYVTKNSTMHKKSASKLAKKALSILPETLNEAKDLKKYK